MRDFTMLLGLLALLATARATTAGDSGFLDDYSRLVPVASEGGSDRLLIAPGSLERLSAYNAVLIDQPQVLISPESAYRGAKPVDLGVIAELVRQRVGERLTRGGYRTATAPAHDVMVVRLAVSDLRLKSKKRSLLGYTPIGAVATATANAVKDLVDRVDILEFALEAEVSDSTTGDVLAAAVIRRGGAAGSAEQRMDFDAFGRLIDDYGDRLRCRLDNSKLPEERRIDCLDAAARAAREGG